MHTFIAMIVGGFLQAAGSFVGRALLSLGLGYFAFTGITTLLESIKATVQSQLAGAPAEVVAVMAAIKVDVAVSIIFSAIAARLILRGLTSAAGGTIKRIGVK